MGRTRTLARLAITALAAATALTGVLSSVASAGTARGGPHVLKVRGAKAGHHGSGSTNMSFHGGYVEPSAAVYIVYWGSQWGTSASPNDPTGEIPLQANFFQHIGGAGDTWSRTTTQYCENDTLGSYSCTSGATMVSQPAENVLAGTWFDNGSLAPSRPTQAQIAAEAANAATHFGLPSATNDQVVVDTSTGNSETGFGTQWCAYHGSTSWNGANLAYTYMPYMTDAGASCGANFITPSNGVNGTTEGVTIVGGHEYAETVTDAFPNSVIAWEDSSGNEIGDKCAWNSGEHGIISINGAYFAVQSLWSNNKTSKTNPAGSSGGGCILSYTSASTQN